MCENYAIQLEIDAFNIIFPRSLVMCIAQHTNERLFILNRDNNMNETFTDEGKIRIVLGVILIMCYNRVPALRDYWSKNESLGYNFVKKAISRNRFQMLISKMYFNNPEKPAGADKLYYVEELINCFKHTFLEGMTDSTFQSIDESMVKFKGRSTGKQYLPLKPIKRGVKIWERCDARTGYV